MRRAWDRKVGIPAVKGLVSFERDLVLLRMVDNPPLVNGLPVNESWQFYSWKSGVVELSSNPTNRSEDLEGNVKLRVIQDVEWVRGTSMLLVHWITRAIEEGLYGVHYEIMDESGHVMWSLSEHEFYSDMGYDAIYKVVDSLKVTPKKHILVGLNSRFQVLVAGGREFQTFAIGPDRAVQPVE
jgi:hypothetical protein